MTEDAADFDNAFMSEDYAAWDNFDSTMGMNTHTYSREPMLGDYMFEQQNPYLENNQASRSAFEEGKLILESHGNLSLAALAFEAAVQQDPNHVEAWVLLGAAQAQNEKESPAIRALEKALQLDPNNLDALMGLAVSYTNEGYDSTAYRTLERWLSVKYPHIHPPENLSDPAEVGFTDRAILHERVADLFIKAAQLSPSGEQMDPDVQVGLGVLFYGNEDFEKAVDCFKAALASTESGLVNRESQVHLLWNRLGATLANSGKSEDAITAYCKALEVNPNFVRARYNLGVSCINIGCYPEAAGHLLGALNLHRIVSEQGLDKAREIVGDGDGNIGDAELERMIQQNESSNLYDTLRRAFTGMGRRDLTERVGAGMSLEQFRPEFDF
jgi:peroxin-5